MICISEADIGSRTERAIPPSSSVATSESLILRRHCRIDLAILSSSSFRIKASSNSVIVVDQSVSFCCRVSSFNKLYEKLRHQPESRLRNDGFKVDASLTAAI